MIFSTPEENTIPNSFTETFEFSSKVEFTFRWSIQEGRTTNSKKESTEHLKFWNTVIKVGKNLDIAYKLWNAKIHSAARLLRQIGSQSSLIVSYNFFLFKNTQTIATHEASTYFQNLPCPTTFTSLIYNLLVKI